LVDHLGCGFSLRAKTVKEQRVTPILKNFQAKKNTKINLEIDKKH